MKDGIRRSMRSHPVAVFAPALFHPAMNASGELLPRTGAATIIFAVLTVVAVLTDRMWRRPGEGML
jgi:hypothetical protein